MPRKKPQADQRRAGKKKSAGAPVVDVALGKFGGTWYTVYRTQAGPKEADPQFRKLDSRNERKITAGTATSRKHRSARYGGRFRWVGTGPRAAGLGRKRPTIRINPDNRQAVEDARRAAGQPKRVAGRPRFWEIGDIVGARDAAMRQNVRREGKALGFGADPKKGGRGMTIGDTRYKVSDVVDEDGREKVEVIKQAVTTTTGPHQAMVEAGVDEKSIEEGEFQEKRIAKDSKQAIIQELLQKYPNKARNERVLKRVARKKVGVRTGFGRLRTPADQIDDIGIPAHSYDDVRKGGAFFGRQPSERTRVLKYRVVAVSPGLEAISQWMDNILKTVPSTQYQVALIAEAFRPTYKKMLRYTPFNPLQPAWKEAHLLETMRFDYGVRAGGAFMRVSFGDHRTPYAGYVYEGKESWNWQGEGRPRWIERAVEENEKQFMTLMYEYLSSSVLTGPGGPGSLSGRHGGIGARGLDKMLEAQFYMDVGSAMIGEKQFAKTRGGRLVESEQFTAEEFLENLQQYIVPAGYGEDTQPNYDTGEGRLNWFGGGF